MRLGAKVRETADKISEAATDTRQAITVVGAVSALALCVALVALALAARRRRA